MMAGDQQSVTRRSTGSVVRAKTLLEPPNEFFKTRESMASTRILHHRNEQPVGLGVQASRAPAPLASRAIRIP